MNHLKAGDFLAALFPPSGAVMLTLADANGWATFASVILGAAYLARKWYREERDASRKDRHHRRR